MDRTQVPPVISLPRHASRRLVGPPKLRAERGTLWVTVDGSPDDILLEAGDSRCFAAGDRVLVHALGGDAEFRAWPPVGRRGRTLARLGAWLGRQRMPATAGYLA
jgi:hypothetical protein